MNDTAPQLRIALAQVNPTVGDLSGNLALMTEWIDRARSDGARLILFPEMVVGGYPAEDMWMRQDFVTACREVVDELATRVSDEVVLVGFPEAAEHRVFNSLAVLRNGVVEAIYRKHELPNYGVFDEARYFERGTGPRIIEIDGTRVALTICEDVWKISDTDSRDSAALEELAGLEFDLLVNASASPYELGKGRRRLKGLSSLGVPAAMCNLIGGQDELVFDGHSLVVDAEGGLVARGKQFAEELIVFDLGGPPPEMLPAPQLPVTEEIYSALRLALADYIGKNGFPGVLVAVSGGIDSALVALLAADAVGAERCHFVVMPSPHSSDATQGDAVDLGNNLGVRTDLIPIAPAMDTLGSMLGEVEGLVAENLQARIRGNLMMAMSNRDGYLLLTTGNKSESAVGYCTLYGDMAGGFAPIKDLPKQMVYELTIWRNQQSPEPPVPPGIIERPPSAELRPDQRDDDSLPPYETLDRILEMFVEGHASREQIVAAGFDEQTVDEIIALVLRAEYKRRQSAPGPKITPRAFGRERRMPITNRFRGTWNSGPGPESA